MALEQDIALVLKVVDFSETSRVATLFTREHGKLTVLAKGARRLRSPFEAALDLLTVCRIVFIRKSTDSLDLLTEAEVVKRFRPRRAELVHYYGGFYVAELLATLTSPYDPFARLFDEALATLKRLEQAPPVALVLARFELAVLRELGHAPRLDACAACGQPLQPSGRTSFSVKAGGLLCTKCRAGQTGIVTITAGTVQTLRWLAATKAPPLERLKTDRRSLAEIRGLLRRCLKYLAGHEFRLHRYLKA